MVFRYPPATSAGVDISISVIETIRVRSGQRAIVDVEPLEREAVGKPSFEFDVGQMGIGIASAIQPDEVPVLIGAQQITSGWRRLPGTSYIIVFRLSGIQLELLLQVSAKFPNVAEPQRGLERQFVLQRCVPRLCTAITPIASVPDRGS